MKKYSDILKKLYSVNLFKPKKESLEIIENAAKVFFSNCQLNINDLY